MEAENGSRCDGSSIHHGVGNGDGIHRGGGCSHATGVGRVRSSLQMVDIHRLDEMMGANESGSGRCEESHPESAPELNRRAE